MLLQKTLHLPVVRRSGKVTIDYLGATLLMGGVSILLIWVTLAGNQFGWTSAVSVSLVVGGLAIVAAAVYVEARVAVDPIIPLRLFRDRTTALATGASLMVGVAMFGATVYLSQYFQIARGMSPTHAGLMTVFMVGGLVLSSMVTGRIITRTGTWKRYLVGGMVAVVIGMVLLSQIDETTPLWVLAVDMAVLGLGLGATMQNLVLSVQNNAAQADIGVASSLVAFSRSLGGSVGRGRARRRPQPPGRGEGDRGPGRDGAVGQQRAEPPDPRPGHAPRAGARPVRAGLRGRHRTCVPGRGTVRRTGAGLRGLHP